jgi:phage tail protein X
MPKSKDIKRVHSVKNAVLGTSHGFAKLTPFIRHQKQIKYSKKNVICRQQPVPSLRFQSFQSKL